MSERGWWARAAELARVVTSGRAPPAVVEARLRSCVTCPKRYVRPDGRSFCLGCDCPEWGPAELDNKLRWAWLPCPLGRAGFSNAKG